VRDATRRTLSPQHSELMIWFVILLATRAAGVLHGWAMAAAAGGWSGVIPATVHVQVRRLQPLLPGARGRAAGRARHYRVLPGGVEVQVRQPPLHAMSAVRASRQAASQPASEGSRAPAEARWAYAPLLHRAGWLSRSRLRCAARARAVSWSSRRAHGRDLRSAAARAGRGQWRPTTLTGCRLGPLPGDAETVHGFFRAARWNSHGPTTSAWRLGAERRHGGRTARQRVLDR
jgi:hypothetical protein